MLETLQSEVYRNHEKVMKQVRENTEKHEDNVKRFDYIELSIQSMKKRMTDVAKQSRENAVKIFSDKKLTAGVSPELVAEIRLCLETMEKDLTDLMEHREKFNTLHLRDIT